MKRSIARPECHLEDDVPFPGELFAVGYASGCSSPGPGRAVLGPSAGDHQLERARSGRTTSVIRTCRNWQTSQAVVGEQLDRTGISCQVQHPLDTETRELPSGSCPSPFGDRASMEVHPHPAHRAIKIHGLACGIVIRCAIRQPVRGKGHQAYLTNGCCSRTNSPRHEHHRTAGRAYRPEPTQNRRYRSG